MKKPKAALIYYDNYELIAGLSNEQLGVLFRAVMDYGKLLLRGESVPIDRFRREYPDMEAGTYGFFAFMADNVRRDAAAYREKCANYSAAGRRREELKRSGRAARTEQDDTAYYLRQFMSGDQKYTPPQPDSAQDDTE